MDALISAAELLEKVGFAKFENDDQRKAFNDTTSMLLSNPPLWEIYRAFLDANLGGELAPVARH